MKKLIFTIITAIIVLPFVALAEETTAGGQAVASLLEGVVFPVVTAFLLGLVGIVINKVRIKYNLDISAEKQSQLESLALRGIAYAEEKASDYAKNKAKTLTGSDKLDIAVAHILTAMPKISDRQAEAIVNSVLGQVKGLGASGEKAVSK
jgi:hypothetical protein